MKCSTKDNQMKIEDKILKGYCYHIKKIYPDGPLDSNDRVLSICTGSGGTLMFIKTCRESGRTEDEIGQMISVRTDDWGVVELRHLDVKKNLEESGK